MLLFKQSSLTLGKRDPHHIVVTSSYIPDDQNEAAYGSVYFTFVLKDHKEIAAEVKNIIIDSFRDHFYQDLERNPEQSFEETLQAINDNVSQMAQAENILWEESLSIALGVFSHNDLHLSIGGMGSIYLGRGHHLTFISEGLLPGEGTVENKIFYSLASGNLLPKDHIVLSTERLEDIVDMDALKARIKHLHVDEEALPSLKHAHLQIIDCEEATQAVEIEEATPPLKSAPTHIHEREHVANHPPITSSNRLMNTFAILKDNIKKSLERIFNRSGKPYVKKPLPLNKLIAGGVVAVIIIFGLYWLTSAQQSSNTKKNLQALLTEVGQDQEVAKSRINIDRESAKNLLLADQKRLVDALNMTNDTILIAQINGELQEITQLLESADQVFKVDDAKVAYDLSKERSNFEGKGLITLGNDLYAFDSDAIYRLALDKPTRRTVIVNGNTVNAIQLATTITKDNAIELYTADGKLIEFKNDTFSDIPAPGGTDATWKSAIALTEYIDRKFMYFLDPAGNTVWRYGRDASGALQAPISKNIANLNLSKAVSIAVDGAVYILTSEGKISKTYADEVQDFVIDGLSKDFNEPTKIIADKNADNGNLYILDAKNNRIVVLSKSGKYQKQYVLSQYSDIIDIKLVPGLTKEQLMVMTKSGKVLEVELK